MNRHKDIGFWTGTGIQEGNRNLRNKQHIGTGTDRSHSKACFQKRYQTGKKRNSWPEKTNKEYEKEKDRGDWYKNGFPRGRVVAVRWGRTAARDGRCSKWWCSPPRPVSSFGIHLQSLVRCFNPSFIFRFNIQIKHWTCLYCLHWTQILRVYSSNHLLVFPSHVRNGRSPLDLILSKLS